MSPPKGVSPVGAAKKGMLTWSILTLRSAVGKVFDASLTLASVSANTGVDPDLPPEQLLAIDAVHGCAGFLGCFKVNEGVGGVAVGEGINGHADTSKVETIGSEQVLDILARGGVEKVAYIQSRAGGWVESGAGW